MKLLFVFLFSMSAIAAETDFARISRMVKQRKTELKQFHDQVSMGDKCRVRDYACFGNEIEKLVKGHPEDVIEARQIMDPFYKRSITEGFPPCSDTCQNTMLAQHVWNFLKYLRVWTERSKLNQRVEPFPTVDTTRIRAYLDLSAFHHVNALREYLQKTFATIKFDKVIVPELTDKNKYIQGDTYLDSVAKPFADSILCHINHGDIVYEEMVWQENSENKSHKNYAVWMKDFNENARQQCSGNTPIEYRGTDKSTRNFYKAGHQLKLLSIDCQPGDFGCMRKGLRTLTIHYADDVKSVSDFMNDFMAKSKPNPCDETCEAQFLLKTIQTWITYFSQYDRSKLASTMDWEKLPEGHYLTITEDVDFYRFIKAIFNPLITEFGKIDPQKVKDKGLMSELRSMRKDLSDLSSAKMLKEGSVICTMEPWSAKYDKYMVPYKDKDQNKKFEMTFVEFKEKICK